MAKERNNIKTSGNGSIGHNISRLLTKLLTWLGVAILYYIVFSMLFDTPAEYALRHSTDKLRQEYDELEARYDTLSMVLDNVIERDRNIFRILFESEPYDFNSEYEQQRLELHKRLLEKSNRKMMREMGDATCNLESRLAELEKSYEELQDKLSSLGDRAPTISRRYSP